MKKIIIIFTSLFFIFVFCYNTAAQFFITPVSPTVDAPDDVAEGFSIVNTTKQSTQTYQDSASKKDLNKARSAKKRFAGGGFKGIFKKNKHTPVAGTSTIKECKDVDIHDADSVKKAVYRLFLAYPSDDVDIKNQYTLKRKEFYQDSLIEIYTASRNLEREIEKLRSEVKKLPNTLRGEGEFEGAEDGEDVNGVWKNAASAYEVQDRVLQIIEELTALKTQFEAAKEISSAVSPAPYTPKSKKPDKVSHRITSPLAFAQVFLEEQSAESILSAKEKARRLLEQNIDSQAVSFSSLSVADKAVTADNKTQAVSSSKAVIDLQRDKIATTNDKAARLENSAAIDSVSADMGVDRAPADMVGAESISIKSSRTADTAAYQKSSPIDSSTKFIGMGVITTGSSQALDKSSFASSNIEEDDKEYIYDPYEEDSEDSFFDDVEPATDSALLASSADFAELEKLDPAYDAAKQAIEIHNIAHTLPNLRDLYERYEQYKRLHARSLQGIKDADACAMQYLGRYYIDPLKTWTGVDLGERVNDYDLRKGISGWAVKAYEVAKVNKTVPVSADDLGELETPDDFDSINLQNMEEKAANKENAQGFIKPSQEENMLKTARESGKLPWDIGAEAARMLVKDQYAATPKWGIPKKKFPIWTDLKNYYSQYIDGKYANIKDYMEHIDIRPSVFELLSAVGEIYIKELHGKASTPEEKETAAKKEAIYKEEMSFIADLLGESFINSQQRELEANQNTQMLYANLSEENKAKIASAVAKRDSVLNPLLEEKNKLLQTLDIKTLELDKNFEEINKLEEEENLSTVKADSAREDIKLTKEHYGDSDKTLRVKEVKIEEYKKNIGGEEKTYTKEVIMLKTIPNTVRDEATSLSEARFTSGRTAAEELGKKAASSRVEANVKKENIEQIKSSISTLEEKIKVIEEEYAAEVAAIEGLQATASASVLEGAKLAREAFLSGNKNASELYASRLTNNPLLPGGLNLKYDVISDVLGMIKQSETMLFDARSEASKAVDDALKDIYAFGDNLYISDYNDHIVKRHVKLMEELQNLSRQNLLKSPAIAGFSGHDAIINIVSSAFKAIMLENVCKGNSCKQPDEDYFIGAVSKARDFKAPFSPPEEYLPPPREVVYFSSDDYVYIKEQSEGFISRENFLNYGGKIPQIWKLILRHNTFIEKDINLHDLLQRGGEGLSFFNGGIFPCNSGKHTISVAPKQHKYLVSDILGDYPECQEVRVKGSLDAVLASFATVEDIGADVTGIALTLDKGLFSNALSATLGFEMAGDGTIADYTSELGVFLSPKDENLQFSSIASNVFKELAKINKEISNPKKKYKKNLKDELLMKSPFKRNQLGDFLNFIDLEMTIRQSMEEIAVEIEESQKELVEMLQKVGFDPGSNMNLANEQEYKRIYDQLDSMKNSEVNLASEQLKKVNTLKNKVAEERVNKIKRLIVSLQKDKNELLPLTEATPSDSELDEAIKSAEVDQKASGEYKKRAAKEFENQIKNFPLPYCAIY